MAILSQVGRRSWKSRLMVAHIYAVLLVGAATMVVPFLPDLELADVRNVLQRQRQMVRVNEAATGQDD